MNQQDLLIKRITAAEAYLNLVTERSQNGGQDETGARMLGELGAALEELRVAEDELRAQNEQLRSTQGALERERRRYQELFDFAPDAYLVTNARGVIEEANHAISALIGFARRYVLGKPLAAMVAAEDQHAFQTRLAQLQESTGSAIQTWEQRLRPRRQGQAVEGWVRVAPVRDDQGRLISLRWLIRDVTAQKQRERDLAALSTEMERRVRERTAQLEAAQQVNAAWLTQEQAALAESELRYQRLFDQARDGLFRADAAGRLHAVNMALAAMLGYGSPEELLAASSPAFHLEEQITLSSRPESEAAYEETTVAGRRADGTQVRLHLRLWPVQDANEALTAIEGIAWPSGL